MTMEEKRPSRYGFLPFFATEANYSQPKLELYGLFHTMRHFHLYRVGTKNLRVEVDGKYIRGMLNEPELQPNAVINKWIQGILLFDFELVHVSAVKFKGPDTLSRIPVDQSKVLPYDDSWLNEIALYNKINSSPRTTPTSAFCLMQASSYTTNTAKQEITLADILNYLTNPSPSAASEEFLKIKKYQVKAGKLFKQVQNGQHLLVILDGDKHLDLMNQAHESLGHHGARATWENL